MGKYSKYTGGQWEAIGNMLGGEPVLDKLLRGEVEVAVHDVVRAQPGKTFVVCGTFNGNRCTIDGSFFGDGDNVCAQGHIVGQQYEK